MSDIECDLLVLGTGTYRQIHISASRIGKIAINEKIDYALDIGGKSRLQELYLNRIEIEPKGYIHIWEVELGGFHIRNIDNKGRIFLEKIGRHVAHTWLHIHGSNMGRSVFSDFKFDEHDRIEIVASNLVTIETYGSHFPLDPSSRCYKMEFAEISRLFSNLHDAARSIGSREMEQRYYSSYLEAKRLSLKNKKGLRAQKISLLLHKFSSDYGQNWILPLIWIASSLPFFFLYYVIPNPALQMTAPWNGEWEYFGHFIGKYLEFLLPTYKTNFLYAETDGWFILDFAFRIINGFLIYQLIVAFRRVGKF